MHATVHYEFINFLIEGTQISAGRITTNLYIQ